MDANYFCGVLSYQESLASEKQRRMDAKRQREANIMGNIAKMGRKFLDTHYKDILDSNDGESPVSIWSFLITIV